MNEPITRVMPGDYISKFTVEQVLQFPDEIKARVAYNDRYPLKGNADCALVLGGPASVMESRAQAAATLYHADKVPMLIVSGGVLREDRTEARILKDYLLDLAVPEAAIIEESRSTNTVGNMEFCRQLLEEHFPGKTLTIAVVTSRFHRYRATVLAQAYFPGHTVFGVGAELPLDNPAEYLQDPIMCKRINVECRCLWHYVNEGRIPDFPVL